MAPYMQLCQNVPWRFPTYRQLFVAHFTLDYTGKHLADKGAWHLPPTTTNHFDRDACGLKRKIWGNGQACISQNARLYFGPGKLFHIQNVHSSSEIQFLFILEKLHNGLICTKIFYQPIKNNQILLETEMSSRILRNIIMLGLEFRTSHPCLPFQKSC